MKKNAQLLLILLICFPIAICAAPPLGQQKISMDVKNESLDHTLKQLSELSGYYILYKSEDVAHVKEVTLNLKDVTVEEILKKCLQGTGLTYEVDNRTILVLKDEGAGKGGSGQRQPPPPQVPQVTEKTGSIKGMVYEGSEKEPLPYAHVHILPIDRSVITDFEGNFEFLKLDEGRINLIITMLGMVTIDTTFTLGKGQQVELRFAMQSSSFYVKDVSVIATQSKTNLSTSSVITREALDHLQANSLADVMQLLPGELMTNPDIYNANYFTIRSDGVGGQAVMNSLGTAIVMNGAPLSNNANFQNINASRDGSIENPAYGGSFAQGIDLRQISTDNIESIEVIRGIPGVEYGDLTSGAVIINPKAGYEPIMVRLKANPKIYEANISQGFKLKGKKGNLNPSFNYARQNQTAFNHYNRVNAGLIYSNVFGKLNLTTSVNYTLGKNLQTRNPDNDLYLSLLGQTDHSLRFNVNGKYQFTNLWLKSINFTLSADGTNQYAVNERDINTANAPYSTSVTHGSVLASIPGKEIYHEDGYQITNIPDAERNARVGFLPYSYHTRMTNDGKPRNFFGKLNATISKQFTKTINNRVVVGLDFKSNGNTGTGKQFDPAAPPDRTYTSGTTNATLRPRKPSDVPFLNQLGLYAEENFLWTFAPKMDLRISAGIRYDKVAHLSATTPRINASLDLIPKILTLRGGYGVSAKIPPLMYLYPENAYYDIINFDNTANELIPASERFTVVSTYVYDVDNADVQMATNRKKEVGFDLKLGKILTLNATFFDELMTTGYRMGYDVTTAHTIEYPIYATVPGSANPFELRTLGTQSILLQYREPKSDVSSLSKGVEFELTPQRFNAIRSTFSLSGRYQLNEVWNRDNIVSVADQSNPDNTEAVNFCLMEGGPLWHSSVESFLTTLRTITNFPKIGMVFTVTTQVVWANRSWSTPTREFNMIEKYLSYKDGQWHPFTWELYEEALKGLEPGAEWREFTSFFSGTGGNIIDPIETRPDRPKPYLLMNLHLTKEVSNFLRISFFANNLMNSYPARERTAYPGRYQRMNRNTRLYFGIDMAVTIR